MVTQTFSTEFSKYKLVLLPPSKYTKSLALWPSRYSHKIL